MNMTTYDLSDFGALTNDPSANLADAFDAVFTDMDANDPGAGGLVVIPPGDYYVHSPIEIRRDFITIEGANYGWRTGTGNGGGSRLFIRTDQGLSAPAMGQRSRSLVFRNFLLDFAENQDRLVVAGNNFFPDGYSNVALKNCQHSTVTGNQFQSYYTGMFYLEGAAANHNSVVSNTFVSEAVPRGSWNVNPSVQFPEDFGIVRVEGRHNVLTANQIDSHGSASHTLVRLLGDGNHLSDSNFNARNGSSRKVQVDGGTTDAPNVVLDCVTDAEIEMSVQAVVRFRSLPGVV